MSLSSLPSPSSGKQSKEDMLKAFMQQLFDQQSARLEKLEQRIETVASTAAENKNSETAATIDIEAKPHKNAEKQSARVQAILQRAKAANAAKLQRYRAGIDARVDKFFVKRGAPVRPSASV